MSRFGEGAAGLERLRAAPVERPPRAGRYWKGINHGELAAALEGAAREAGMAPSRMEARLDPGGGGADIVLELGGGPQLPPGARWGLAVRNDNGAKGGPVRAWLLACGEGWDVPLASLPLGRSKHTIRLTPGGLAADVARAFLSVCGETARELRQLRATRVKRDELDGVVALAGQQGVLPWSLLGRVHKAAAGDPQGRTAWSVLEAAAREGRGGRRPFWKLLAGLDRLRQMLPRR